MMNTKHILTTVLMALVGFTASAQTSTNSSWEKFTETIKQKSVVTLEEEFRGKDTDSHLFYQHTDIQYKFLAFNNLDFFTDYRFILKNSSGANGKWADQSMFLEGFNLKLPESSRWGKINLRVREEIGLQTPTSTGVTAANSTTWQLNLFPKYDLPFKWTKYEIQPFVADESFWDTEHGMSYVRNRIYAGLDFKISPKILGGVWYYRENQNTLYGAKNSDVAVAQIRFIF